MPHVPFELCVKELNEKDCIRLRIPEELPIENESIQQCHLGAVSRMYTYPALANRILLICIQTIHVGGGTNKSFE